MTSGVCVCVWMCVYNYGYWFVPLFFCLLINKSVYIMYLFMAKKHKLVAFLIELILLWFL